MTDQFNSLPLKKELLDNLKELNYNSMTPIQAMSLPLVLKGTDVIAQAKTGSGKTAAFGLGILNSLNVSNTRVQALVLCPTRELAEQVAKELRTLARMMKNVKVLAITGGKSEYHQDKSLAHGAHIIVGTPGRVLRLIHKKTLFLDTVHSFVLDEADRMLEMGFIEDITEISNEITGERQTLLFSATFTDEIKEFGSELQKDAQVIETDTGHSDEIIDQKFFLLDTHKDKSNSLLKVLDFYKPDRFIVFCKTKQITDTVADFLHAKEIYAESIHGDLEQSDRTAVLTMFSNRSLSALVATDVAARGLDIQDLELVINYDLAINAETYTHRIGRTARAGKTGVAVSFYVSQEKHKIEEIEDYQKTKLESTHIEDLAEADKYNLKPPMATIYISGGKRDKLRPGDIVGAIVGEAGLDFKDIGDITISTINSFVAIKSEHAENVIEKLNAGRIKNRKFSVGFL
jgi:ATP-independent RNA helicase DbpA